MRDFIIYCIPVRARTYRYASVSNKLNLKFKGTALHMIYSLCKGVNCCVLMLCLTMCFYNWKNKFVTIHTFVSWMWLVLSGNPFGKIASIIKWRSRFWTTSLSQNCHQQWMIATLVRSKLPMFEVRPRYIALIRPRRAKKLFWTYTVSFLTTRIR